MRDVVQRDTTYNIRLDPISRKMVKIVRLSGKDIREFILKNMIFKIENGSKKVHPDLLKLLTDMEEDFKKEYQARIALLEEIRNYSTAIDQKGKDVVHCTTKGKNVVPCTTFSLDDDCPYCDRPLRQLDGFISCTCQGWRYYEQKHGKIQIKGVDENG